MDESRQLTLTQGESHVEQGVIEKVRGVAASGTDTCAHIGRHGEQPGWSNRDGPAAPACGRPWKPSTKT